jgi:SagB-type dehydrogenase family enzyme
VNEPAEAARYHELTKHGGARRSDPRLVEFQPLDPANRPAPFKRYVGLEPVPLPADLEPSGARAADALSGRGPDPAPRPLDASLLARLLFFSAGVTRTADFGRTTFRAAMSAGNLHPVELYVLCGDGVDGVAAGVHHYAPREHALTQLRSDDLRAAVGERDSPAVVVLTGIPFRTAWKYGERGFRHLYWDAGTLLANLLAVAEAHGVAVEVRVGFVDRDVAGAVGVDGVSELPLALAVIGGREAPAPDVEVAPLDLATEPLAAHPIELPLVTDVQRAGHLPDAAAVAAWRDPVAAGPPLDPPEAGAASVEEVVLRRGSTRVMRHEQVPHALLAWGMGVASRTVAGDVPDLLVHLLSVHDVEGTIGGAYRWAGDHPAGGREGDTRDSARQLCLGQPLGGDSAYTVFHSADLDRVLDRFGSRGYRAAQLQAGIASGRLALAAFTLGYGATGLTFLDDLVSQFFGNPAACMPVTSVGVPDYRSRPGGGPRRPVELTGFEQLMGRLALDLRRRRG